MKYSALILLAFFSSYSLCELYVVVDPKTQQKAILYKNPSIDSTSDKSEPEYYLYAKSDDETSHYHIKNISVNGTTITLQSTFPSAPVLVQYTIYDPNGVIEDYQQYATDCFHFSPIPHGATPGSGANLIFCSCLLKYDACRIHNSAI